MSLFSPALIFPVSSSALYDLMRAVGLENIQSVRRFNTKTGSWETSAERETGTGLEIVGIDFPIFSGEGLAITMKIRVDGWRP